MGMYLTLFFIAAKKNWSSWEYGKGQYDERDRDTIGGNNKQVSKNCFDQRVRIEDITWKP